MLETGSSPEDEKTESLSVSPLSSHHGSRSSSPGISSFDGTPLYLYNFSCPPQSPRSTSTPQDMARKPAHHPENGPEEHRTKVKSTQRYGSEPQVSPKELPREPTSSPNTIQDNSSWATPSLADLSHLLRLEKYQSRRCRRAQNRLYQVHTAAARTRRLIHTARSVHRTLAECIKSEDKPSFVNLFNAFRDALSDCSELNHGCPDGDCIDDGDHSGYPSSFVDGLPTGCRHALLSFLTKTRQDGKFIADRLAALTHKELVTLLPEKGLPKSSDSVFGYSPRTSSRTSRHLGFIVDGQTELLSSLEFSSPLETLVHSVREIFCDSLQHDGFATDVWATACARLIAEQKPGMEKLVPAVVDLWASSSSWPGKDRLEIWISQTLQNGLFLLEQPSKQSFRLRVQGRQEPPVEDHVRAEKFYSEAVISLLALLGDPNGASVIPEGALDFCRATCHRLRQNSGHQLAFPSFIITRWLFSSFIPDAVTLPEMHGMMTDYFIPDNARQRILREVASRCQKVVFDAVYSWKMGNTVPVEAARPVQALADLFRDVTGRVVDPVAGANSGHRGQGPYSGPEGFVAVTAADVAVLVNALYPQHQLAPFSSDHDLSSSGLHSSASSISGFSLFHNNPGLESTSVAVPTQALDNFQPSVSDFTEPSELKGDSFESSILEPEPDVDGEQLREVCSAIEDFLTGGRPSSLDQWWVFMMDERTQSLCTIQDKLLHVQDSAVPVTLTVMKDADGEKAVAFSGDYRTSKLAVQELLFDDELDNEVNGLLDLSSSWDTLPELHMWISQAFDQRIANLEERSEFVAAHAWFRKFRCFHAISLETSGPDVLLRLLHDVEKSNKRSLGLSTAVSDLCDGWLRFIQPCIEASTKELLACGDSTRYLRDKMWYVADVRTSAAYDEARAVASALKVMGKPKRPPRTRLAPPLRHWSGPKLSNTNLHLKTEAQILELLSASPDHGGPNKLGDDQSRALSTWMERHSVENLCRGEERLHKLCMEIRKAVDQLTAEGSTLLSGPLFARDSPQAAPQPAGISSNPFWSPPGVAGRFDFLRLHTNVPPSIDALSSTSSHPLSTRSSRDYLESRSPTLTNKSSAPFWSPAMTEAQSPSSATSIGSAQTQAAPGNAIRKRTAQSGPTGQSMIEELRQRAVSLLLSDLASPLFKDGSETDRAFWTGLGGELTHKHLLNFCPIFSDDDRIIRKPAQFDFLTAFRKLFRRFSATCNPYVKLLILLDIDTLLAPYVTEQAHALPSFRPELRQRSVSLHQLKHRPVSPVADLKVDGFRMLFANGTIRPSGIFRDLQYIASLVPSTTLETTAQGKAFWNAAVAISGIKQEARNILVETADSIVAYHSNNRGHGRASSVAQQQRDSATFSAPSRTPSAEDIARYTMADAAYLLQITAREGDAVAQRELGTLYLTHPELMDHIIAPFSRPRDVFKEELESKWRKNQDPNRCDPATMCVAHHWMSLSSRAGDALAKEFLRQREEMERLP